MTASGTAGHGAELGALRRPGRARRGRREVAVGRAVGRATRAPRVHETPAGMLNSVGLQGPGVEAWLADDLPAARWPPAPGSSPASGAARVEDYARGRRRCWPTRPPRWSRSRSTCRARTSRPARDLFAHVAGGHRRGRWRPPPACGRPRWAKLSPNVDRPGRDRRGRGRGRRRGGHAGQHRAGHGHRPRDPAGTGWAGGGGGLSGPAIHPVAVRAVYDVHAALPGPADRGRRRRRRRGRRGRAAAGRRSRRAGRHGDVRRPRAPRPGARPSWKTGAGATACAALRRR